MAREGTRRPGREQQEREQQEREQQGREGPEVPDLSELSPEGDGRGGRSPEDDGRRGRSPGDDAAGSQPVGDAVLGRERRAAARGGDDPVAPDDENDPGPPVADGRPVAEIIELTPPGDVAREALNRARAAARAKGLYPGAQRRRILADPPRSGPGKDGRDPKLFAETLAALLQQRGWVQEVSVGGVIGRWREVVGADIADHCTPETFEDHALVVRADSTAWATQIRLLVPRLLALMEQEVGQDVVQSITVLGPAGPGFGKGPRSVRGRGVRDTYG